MQFSPLLNSNLGYKVLMIEDQDDFAGTTADVLKRKGVAKVEIVKTVHEANAALQSNAFDAIIADAWLQSFKAQKETQTGDQWLYENFDATRHCFKAVLTGQPQRMKVARQDLEKRDIRVVIKGAPGQRELLDDLGSYATHKTEQLLRAELAKFESARPPTAAQNLEAAVKGLFAEWVDSLSFRGEQVFAIGSRIMTPSELADEVSKGTELGQKTLERFLRFLRAKMGLPK